VSGPWLKLGEAIEFVRTVGAAHAFPIHDANLSEIGMENFDAWLSDEPETVYARIPVGGSVDLSAARHGCG
jgi:hypothetical protein